MKIAITADPEIPVPPTLYGGIERIIFSLIEELIRQGHEVTLFAHKDSKVPCRLIAYASNKRSRFGLVRNTVVITKTVLTTRFDVIHSFGRLAYLTFILPLGIKKVMSYQREPTITQIKKALKLSKQDSLIFTGCSNYITDKIKPIAPALTIYNFVDPSLYQLVEKVQPDAPLVFLGRIEYIKGAHIAIEVAKISGRKLILAGNIPTEQHHKTYFKTMIEPFIDNETISYVGPVTDKQKNDLLGRAAAFLMPVLWNEPFGIVMAEALACGTPIIGFPRGAIPEVIEDGQNGYICNNALEMAQKIQMTDKISRLYCRDIALKKFSAKTIVSQYLNAYLPPHD